MMRTGIHVLDIVLVIKIFNGLSCLVHFHFGLHIITTGDQKQLYIPVFYYVLWSTKDLSV